MDEDTNAFESITGTGDSQAANMIKMHAALVGNAMKKFLRKVPMTTNASGSLRGPVAGQQGGQSQFNLRAPKGCRTIVIKNYLNVTAYVWQGDDVSGGQPAWLTVGTMTWLQFACDPAIEVYTISVAQPSPPGSPTYATSGTVYAQCSDSDLGCATGALFV